VTTLGPEVAGLARINASAPMLVTGASKKTPKDVKKQSVSVLLVASWGVDASVFRV
jgi:hypothetical protein